MSLRGGRYEILGTIATGGMATVHLGRALGAGGFERLVAIKTMHPHLAAEEEFVAMFLDEARLAARIRHPNVVATLDVQQDDQGLFLVMEYVEGPSVSRLLRALQKKDLRLPLDMTLRIFSESLAGLHAAHELTGPDGEPLQLIHRDVSPHNILVGTDGIAKITDFGVARATSRLATTRTGAAKGKINYMPPEQARSQGLDRRADIYSAGVVLWEMLTRERLVRGDSEMELLEQIIRAERRPPHEVFAEVPVEISAVCMRAIERDRDNRFPTAAAFSEALEKAAQACGITAAPARAVAAFVREQKVHIAASDIPPSGSHPEMRGPMMSVLSSGAQSGPESKSGSGGQTPAPKSGSLPGGQSGSHSGAHPESIPAVGATLATVALPGSPAARRGSRRTRLLLGAGAAVLLGGAALWFFALRGESGASGAAGVPAGKSLVSQEPAATPPPSATIAVEPSATATATSTTAQAASSTSASAKASGPAGSGAPRVGATAGPKVFRPKEL